MDSEIYALVVKYGFRNLHKRLEELMLNEYEYLKEHFLPKVENTVQFKEIVNLPIVEVPKNTLTMQKKRKQQIKQQPTQVLEPPIVESTKEIIITDLIPQVESITGFRDPKEVKQYQKEQEEKKRVENEAQGIDISKILTRDNLKQWIEVEGHTYAWVAREKAGCSDTQVSATAQMLGIKSSISKKRGIMMSR